MELALEDMGKPIGEEDYQLIHSGCAKLSGKSVNSYFVSLSTGEPVK